MISKEAKLYNCEGAEEGNLKMYVIVRGSLVFPGCVRDINLALGEAAAGFLQQLV